MKGNISVGRSNSISSTTRAYICCKMVHFRRQLAALFLGLVVSQVCLSHSAPLLRGLRSTSCQHESNYLGSEGRRAVLSCNPPSDAYDIRSIDWKLDGRPLDIRGPKHEKMANRLVITNVESSDEGVYSCVVTDDRNTQTEVEVSCLFVLGKATFASCPEEQSCSDVEEITVPAGNDIRFDTRVMYINSGPTLRHQATQSLQLLRRNSNVYFCLEWGQYMGMPCRSNATGRVHVVQGSHKFDVQLLREHATFDDSGDYMARVEAINPSTGATTVFMKYFDVTVEAPPACVSVGSIGAPLAGSEYSLTCSHDAPGSTAQLQWVDPSGMVLDSSDDWTILQQDDGSLQLKFSSLAREHGGNYTCKATVTWTAYNILVTQSRSIEFKVVEITDVTAVPVSGSEVQVTWKSSGQPSSIAQYIMYTTALSGGVLHSAHSIRVHEGETSAIVELDELTIDLEYQFQVSATILASDGTYVVGQRTLVTSETTVTYDEKAFQLTVGPVEQCTLWNLDEEKAEFVGDAIRKGVAQVLMSSCNCNFPLKNIRKGRLLCGDNTASVTYSSVVVGHGNVTASELHQYIVDWAKSDGTPQSDISIGRFLISVLP